MRPEFIEFLREFQLRRAHVTVDFEEGRLVIAVEGSGVETILQEVPLMAIVSETYFEVVDTEWDVDVDAYGVRAGDKGRRLTEAGCDFIDFGTRRRRSYAAGCRGAGVCSGQHRVCGDE